MHAFFNVTIRFVKAGIADKSAPIRLPVPEWTGHVVRSSSQWGMKAT